MLAGDLNAPLICTAPGQMQSERAHELPVFWGHGTLDNTIQSVEA